MVYGLERAAAACSHGELVQNPEDVVQLERLRVPSNRLHLLGNGIDLTRFDPDRPDQEAHRARARRLFGADPDHVVVGVVGRLVAEKGVAEVLAAARSLRDHDPKLRWVLIGPGEPTKADGLDVEALAAEAGSDVVLLGRRDDVDELYPGCDLFVLASHREGFPRAAMEAAAMGLAVVATDIRGCRQVVDDGVTGRLVPVGDAQALAAAVSELADRAETRAAYGAAGRAKAERQFDEQDCIRVTLELYRRLSGSTPAAPHSLPGGAIGTVGSAGSVGSVRAPGGDRGPGPGAVLNLVTTTDRRGAEVAAVDLAAALAERGVPVRTLALWPGTGAGSAALDLPVAGRRPRHPGALGGLVGPARAAAVVVGHGSSTLPFGAAAATVARTPFVYRSIGDPTFWATTGLVAPGSAWPCAGPSGWSPCGRVRPTPWSSSTASTRAAWPSSPPGCRPAASPPPRPTPRPAARRALVEAVPGAAGLDPEAPVVAYLGALAPEKAPALAVEAVAAVPGAHLVMAGSGPLTDQVAQQAERLAPGRVHLLGVVDDPARVLAAADVVVLPQPAARGFRRWPSRPGCAGWRWWPGRWAGWPRWWWTTRPAC